MSVKNPLQKGTEQELQSLVKRLTRSERSYLKKYVAQNKATKYLKLLDWIKNVDCYIREEYIRKQGIKTPKAQKEALNKLRNVEKSLLENICKTFRLMHAERSVLTLLSNLMAEADILKRKGHYHLALDRLKVAEREAGKHNKFFVLIEIIPLKAEVILYLKEEDRQTAIEACYQQLHDTLDRLKQEADFRHMNVQWVLHSQILKRPEELAKEAQEAYEDLIQTGFPNEGTFYAQYYFHSIQAIYAKIHKDIANARIQQEKVVALWDQQDAIKKANAQTYITQLSNLVGYAIADQQYELAQTSLDKIKALKLTEADGLAEQAQDALHGQQLLYMNMEQLEKAHALSAEIKQALVTYEYQINPSRRQSLTYNSLISCFILGKYDEAHDWLLMLERANRKLEPRKDLQQFLEVLRFAIYYYSDSRKFGLELMRKVERKDVANPIIEQFSQFEKLFFYFMKSLYKMGPDDKQDEQAYLLKFAHDLDNLQNNAPLECTFGFGGIYAWVQQKIEKIIQ